MRKISFFVLPLLLLTLTACSNLSGSKAKIIKKKVSQNAWKREIQKLAEAGVNVGRVILTISDVTIDQIEIKKDITQTTYHFKGAYTCTTTSNDEPGRKVVWTTKFIWNLFDMGDGNLTSSDMLPMQTVAVENVKQK